MEAKGKLGIDKVIKGMSMSNVLFQIEVRDKTLSASSLYLNDCVNFALTYNGTEMGARRRKEIMLEEWEEAKVEKQGLEYGNSY